MDFQLSTIELAIGLIVYSFVQGIGYAVATWFFNRRLERHFDSALTKIKNGVKKGE